MPSTLIGLDVQLLAAWIIVIWTILVVVFAVISRAPWRPRAP
jgi:hypothetical protein